MKHTEDTKQDTLSGFNQTPCISLRVRGNDYPPIEATEKAASDCGNAMCEKYGLTIDYSIPFEEAFLQGVEYAKYLIKGIHNSRPRQA